MAQYTLADGDYPTASILNTYAMGEGSAWTSWTPTVTQSGAVTVTSNRSRYARYGRTIHFTADMTVTGSGTASNAVAVSLPVAAATSSTSTQGGGVIADTSANLSYRGLAYINSATTVVLEPANSTVPDFLGATSFTAALAAGDVIRVSGTYEAAS